ncbi:MAG: DUF362 domain-containing protein [Candidatus Helarchaeota archaeon]
MPSVSIVKKGAEESVFEAIRKAVTLLGDVDLKNKQVLIKPNNLNADRNAVTDASVIGSIARLVVEYGGQPIIGDSPMSGGKTSKEIYEKVRYDGGQTGYDIISELAPDVKWINFNENPVLVTKDDNPNFKLLEKTAIARAFVDADFVINACKWKTHFLTRFTGAVKNFWGIQVGTTKSKSHLYGPTPNKFAIVLTDLFSYVHDVLKKDNLVIMDAIQAMHGTGGPSFGSMINLGLILASRDMVALDAVAVKIGGLNPLEDIKFIRECHDRGLGIGNLQQINILGEKIENIIPKQKINFPGTRVMSALGIFQPIGNRMLKRVPRVRQNKCIKCGHCIKICPTESISFDINKYPKIHRQTCINCLCCAEGCPQGAIETPRAGISGMLGLL